LRKLLATILLVCEGEQHRKVNLGVSPAEMTPLFLLGLLLKGLTEWQRLGAILDVVSG
jgi:hypothetical protein